MDSGNEQLPAHADRFSRDPDGMLADLRSGLDALRSLLSEIDAREAELGLDTLRSVVSQLHKLEQPDT
jgi:hypothetical protein